MNPERRRTPLVIILFGLMISACNFPVSATRIASPQAMQVFRIQGLSFRKEHPVRINRFPNSGTPPGTSMPAPPTNCITLYDEDFEKPTVNLGEFSAAQPETKEWTVDNLSVISIAPGLPDSCIQGSYCTGTFFSDVYDDNAEDLMYTPQIDFTGYSPVSAELSFGLAYDLETGYDGMRILVTPDLGSSWYYATPGGGYPAVAVAAFQDGPGYSGDSGGWTQAVVDLSPMLAVGKAWTIAFEFASDYSIGKAGVAIDDVRVAINCTATPTPTPTFSPTRRPTFSPTRTHTPLVIIPTTQVPPPSNPPTLCPPSHPCG
jgi:hypothetical protein